MINELIRYKEEHGDCHVPAGKSEFSESERKRLGVSEELTAWVAKQRRRYRKRLKTKNPKHTDQVRALVLESMGFMWSEREAQWQRAFNRLEAHKAQFGTLEVERDEDPQLWTWLDQQRKAHQREKLPEDRYALLKDIGFIFDLHEAAWNQNFEKLCAYVEENGDARVPTHHDEDPSFGSWVARQRRLYQANQISNERIKALESLGFSWDVYEETWEQFYNELVDFHSEHGHTRVSRDEGPLWFWVDRQRRQLRKKVRDGEFPEDHESKIAALDKMDFDWVGSAEDRARRLLDLTFSVAPHNERWTENYNKLCAFKEEFGHFVIPPNVPEHQDLYSWVRHQRFLNKRGRLPADRVAALDDIGFAWTAQVARWDIMYEKLVRFRAVHGHTKIPVRNGELYRWTIRQRRILREHLKNDCDELDDHRMLALEKILDC